MRPNVPSFRSSLLRMHRTLIEIEGRARYLDAKSPLSSFEKMVLLLEDRRFFTHRGTDFRSVLREAWRLLTFQRHGGASTIDVQLFRTASNRYERTLRRKLRENLGAHFLQRRLSKMQILRTYLDCAYFGTGLNGATQAAASMYPEHVKDRWLDPSKLPPRDAAKLAALLVYPKPRVATQDWIAKVERRTNYALFLFNRIEQQFDQVDR